MIPTGRDFGLAKWIDTNQHFFFLRLFLKWENFVFTFSRSEIDFNQAFCGDLIKDPLTDGLGWKLHCIIYTNKWAEILRKIYSAY